DVVGIRVEAVAVRIHAELERREVSEWLELAGRGTVEHAPSGLRFLGRAEGALEHDAVVGADGLDIRDRREQEVERDIGAVEPPDAGTGVGDEERSGLIRTEAKERPDKALGLA